MSNNGFESSLPTYDQIAGWLGAEWVMMCTGFDDPAPHPSPWTHRVFVGDYQCLLLHAPTGQRVKITAPKEALTKEHWAKWFTGIRLGKRGDSVTDPSGRYREHVRWLDPDTKTSTGSPGTADSVTVLSAPEAGATPVEPVVIFPERWQTKDPTRIAALEAKLAEQVASGGQDCKAARSLVERAERLKTEEFDRQLGYIQEVKSRHTKVQGIQAGPRLSRHELPSGQRLDRKLTGR